SGLSFRLGVRGRLGPMEDNSRDSINRLEEPLFSRYLRLCIASILHLSYTCLVCSPVVFLAESILGRREIECATFKILPLTGGCFSVLYLGVEYDGYNSNTTHPSE